MQQIRFIHAADLHLGSLFKGFSQLPAHLYQTLQNSGYQAFRKLVDDAIVEQVDFVILAGDIYDVEDHNLRAQTIFRKEMERLQKASIPVYLVHGNHDFIGGSRFQLSLPSNVHVFSDSVESKLLHTSSGAIVEFVGFSYGRRNIEERIIEAYRQVYDADYHIAILHGSLGGRTGHHLYAPFTMSDLQSSSFDYWALGHIHKQEVVCVNPLAIYPGSLVGRNRKEIGDKGYYFVSFVGNVSEYEFRSVAEIVWQEETIQLTDLTDFSQLETTVKDRLVKLIQANKSILLSLSIDLTESQEIDYNVLHKADLLTALQNEDTDTEPFIWIHDLQFHLPPEVKQSRFLDEINLLADALSPNELESLLSPLSLNATAHQYLENLNEDELKRLLEEAKLTLYQHWATK